MGEHTTPFLRAGISAEIAAGVGLPSPTPGTFLNTFLHAAPAGIRSWPNLRSKAGLITNLVQHTPPRFALDSLPAEIAELLRHPPPPSLWIPGIYIQASMLAYADALHSTEESYADWVFDLSNALFHHPMYRFLMLVLSPERLLRGTAARWATFHDGTSLRVDIGQKRARCSLIVPPAFVSQRIQLYSNITPMVASVAATGAKNARAESIEAEPHALRFTLAWE